PFTSNTPVDGVAVVTCGFPAPSVTGANLGADGTFLGNGQFFLMSHANEGIVAAQYAEDGRRMLEFNVGWCHGGRGGPIMSRADGGVLAVMQGYRQVQTPHGIVMGPRRGRPLALMASTLTSLGATDVASATSAAA